MEYEFILFMSFSLCQIQSPNITFYLQWHLKTSPQSGILEISTKGYIKYHNEIADQ